MNGNNTTAKKESDMLLVQACKLYSDIQIAELKRYYGNGSKVSKKVRDKVYKKMSGTKRESIVIRSIRISIACIVIAIVVFSLPHVRANLYQLFVARNTDYMSISLKTDGNHSSEFADKWNLEFIPDGWKTEQITDNSDTRRLFISNEDKRIIIDITPYYDGIISNIDDHYGDPKTIEIKNSVPAYLYSYNNSMILIFVDDYYYLIYSDNISEQDMLNLVNKMQ